MASIDTSKGAMQKTVKWTQMVAAMASAGGAFAVGTALGWPSPIGPKLVNDGDDRYFPITSTDFDWVASILTIGCAVSCLPIGMLMKIFGRKWTMIGMVIPFLVGWGLVAWAQNFAMLLTGRFFLGLAGGAFCVSAPQYASEIAEKEIRGTVGVFCVLLIHAGILFVYILGAYASVFWTSIICGIVPLIFGLIFFFMPESPVYLITNNRDEDVKETYKWLRGPKYDPLEEIDEIQRELKENKNNNVSFFETLKKRSTLHALSIGFGLMFFQQASGINVVLFYTTFIFDVSRRSRYETKLTFDDFFRQQTLALIRNYKQ